MTDLELGSTVAGCRIESVAGRGGMGVVYRATQLQLGRPVALKAIAPQLAQDSSYRQRFQRESQITASIEHPNVIPVYEAGELDGLLYLITRWVDGTDLRAVLTSSGRLPPARAVWLLRPVASALAAAHRRGLVHRDVKPANVLIARGAGGEDEHVYLTDFGIAVRSDSEAGMTRTGVFVGTIDYTAPERLTGGRGDALSDVYSFGCMLYETVTGEVPYDRPTEVSKMYAHVNEPVPVAREKATDIPQWLDAIIYKAMAKRPEDRFASAAELTSALDHGAPQRSEAPARPTRIRRGPATAPIEPAAVPPQRSPAVQQAAPAAPAPPAPQQPATAATATAATAPQPARTPPRGRSPIWIVAGAIAVIAVVAVIVALVARGGGGAPPTQVLSGGSSVQTGPPVGLRLSGPATALTVSGTDAWVTGPDQVERVATDGTQQSYSVAGTPRGVAVDPTGRVWITHTGPHSVTVLDPSTNSRTRIDVGQDPTAIVITSSAAWVADSGQDAISRIDLSSLSVTTIGLPNPPTTIGSAYARVWVPLSDGAVKVFDENGQADPVVGPAVPAPVTAVVPSNGVWFLSGSGVLTRVDPRVSVAVGLPDGGQQYRSYSGQAGPAGSSSGIAALQNDNSIWTISAGGRSLSRVGTDDPNNNKLLAKIGFDSEPSDVAVGSQVVWVELTGSKLYPITFSGV